MKTLTSVGDLMRDLGINNSTQLDFLLKHGVQPIQTYKKGRGYANWIKPEDARRIRRRVQTQGKQIELIESSDSIFFRLKNFCRALIRK